MPLCAKHGVVYGEGCTCVKCDAEKKKPIGTPRPGNTKPIK